MIGIDLTPIDEVRESILVFGRRYLERVYTPRELYECGSDPRRLAARFAAKEATMKALAASDRLPWQSIAVCDDGAERPSLELGGPAAELARAHGINSMSVTFTHGASTYAAAIVLMEACSWM